MVSAAFTVQFAGPLVTVQDSGRIGHMRFGVAHSGPMDRLAFAAAHAALGNSGGSAAIEISLGGLMLECKSGSVSVSIAGGDFVIEHNGARLQGWRVLTIGQGDRLAIRAGEGGSWAYLAFAGDLQTRKWLGSAATHSTSGFGGGQLQIGQIIQIDQAETKEEYEGETMRPNFQNPDAVFRVVMGPQENHFLSEARETFLNTEYQLTDSYDRMGVRLDGETLLMTDALAIPSEPVLRGSVQVSGDGSPTILLADHQTTGGYPKIATLVSFETDRLVQKRSRESVRFSAITAGQAVALTRQYHSDLEKYLSAISVPRGTLQQRLMRENLISGMVLDETQQAG